MPQWGKGAGRLQQKFKIFDECKTVVRVVSLCNFVKRAADAVGWLACVTYSRPVSILMKNVVDIYVASIRFS